MARQPAIDIARRILTVHRGPTSQATASTAPHLGDILPVVPPSVPYAETMKTLTSVPPVTIEPARHGDIVDAAQIYQAAAEALSDQLRARNPWASLAARADDLKQAIGVLSNLHAVNERSVIVARTDGQVVGVAAVQIQPPHAHIVFFFVHPNTQNQGVGRQLLARIGEVIDESGATVTTLASSRDPKAWQRYLQFGLHPGPPLLPFRATKATFPTRLPAMPGYMVRPCVPEDLDDIALLDRAVRGADRRDRIAAWLSEGSEGVTVRGTDDGRVAGYALVTMHETHGQIGPVAAGSTDLLSRLLNLALHYAGTVPNPRRRPWRVDLSARNQAAIAPLLDAGFAAENLVNWFETDPVGQWDRYIFRDEDQL